MFIYLENEKKLELQRNLDLLARSRCVQRQFYLSACLSDFLSDFLSGRATGSCSSSSPHLDLLQQTLVSRRPAVRRLKGQKLDFRRGSD